MVQTLPMALDSEGYQNQFPHINKFQTDGITKLNEMPYWLTWTFKLQRYTHILQAHSESVILDLTSRHVRNNGMMPRTGHCSLTKPSNTQRGSATHSKPMRPE